MQADQLRQVLETYHQESFAWALYCCHQEAHAAEDVLQNTYLKILEGKAKYKGAASFKTWLFSVIRFTAIDFWQKQRRYTTLDQVETAQLVVENGFENKLLETDAVYQNFQVALSQLSTQQRQILHLVFYQGLTIAEAATVMDIQVGTARTHYGRGKKQLRKIVANIKE